MDTQEQREKRSKKTTNNQTKDSFQGPIEGVIRVLYLPIQHPNDPSNRPIIRTFLRVSNWVLNPPSSVFTSPLPIDLPK